MHPTAFLILANDRIADLTADTARIRFATQVHLAATAGPSSSDHPISTSLRTIASRLLGIGRPLPPATAG